MLRINRIASTARGFLVPRWPWLVLCVLMGVMLCWRLLPGWDLLVRSDQEFRLAAPDAHYHFRQAANILQDFPHISREDDFSFYPAVMHDDAVGLYDLALATLANIGAVTGMDPMRALWWVCLLIAPLCATAILPLVYHLVRQQGGTAIGLVMALWYVLLPGATHGQMTIGICDHHVIEMLASVLCILQLKKLIELESTTPSTWWRPAWGAALPLALLQFTWLGGPIFLVIFGLAGLGQLIADVLAGVGARSVIRACIRHWLAFLILTGAGGLLFPSLIFLPYLWKATLVGTIGLLATFTLAGWFLETPRFPWRPSLRVLFGVVGALVLARIALVHSPIIQNYFWVGLGPKSTVVAENQIVTAEFYFGVTGLAGILGLLAPVLGIVCGAWRRPGWWIGVLPSLLFIGLWYRTYDYTYQGALHAVLLAGYFFGAAGQGLTRLNPKVGRWLLHGLLGIGTAVVVYCSGPAGLTAPWRLDPEWYHTDSGMPSDGWIQAMRWLRNETPVPPPRRNPVEPGTLPRGQVGVLTDWTTGQFVNTLGERPATSSRYPVPEGMVPFFLRSENEVRQAGLRGSTVAAAVKYVAMDLSTMTHSFFAHRQLLGMTSDGFYGRTNFLNEAGRDIGVPTLGAAYDDAFATRLMVNDGDGYSHFRLVFESPQESFLRFTCDTQSQVIIPWHSVVRDERDRANIEELLRQGLWVEGGMDAYLGRLLAGVKLFEQVAGARVEGTAPPGSTVVLTTPLQLRTTGRTWEHTVSRQTEADGRFTLTTPYATEPAEYTDLHPRGPAVLHLASESIDSESQTDANRVMLTIPESAVQGGETVTWRGWLDSASPVN